MDERETLHTAARWFCIERMARLRRREDDAAIRGRDPYAIAPAAFVQYPRYAALETLLDSVELIEPLREPTVGALIDRIEAETEQASRALAGRAGPGPVHDEILTMARMFHDYLAEVAIIPPAMVSRLPHRRTLRTAESRMLRDGLRRHWPTTFATGIPDSVPALAPDGDEVACRVEDVQRQLGRDGLQRLLIARGTERLCEITAQGLDREIGTDRFEPAARDGAVCWTSEPVDWYVATAGSGWLLAGGWMAHALRETR